MNLQTERKRGEEEDEEDIHIAQILLLLLFLSQRLNDWRCLWIVVDDTCWRTRTSLW